MNIGGYIIVKLNKGIHRGEEDAREDVDSFYPSLLHSLRVP